MSVHPIYRFGSIAELVHHAKTIPPRKEYGIGDAHKSDHNNNKWRGTISFGEAENYALFGGWTEGRDKLIKAMASAEKVTFSVPSLSYDVAGDYPDCALASAGIIESMVSPIAETVQRKPIYRFLVNRGALADYTAEEFTVFGAAIASYIDALETSGTRVEITLFNKASEGLDTIAVYTLLKKAEEPVDIDKFSFALINPSYLRRFVFAIRQSDPTLPHGSMHSCGRTVDISKADIEEGQIAFPQIGIFNKGSKELSSVALCMRALVPHLEKAFGEAGFVMPPLED